MEELLDLKQLANDLINEYQTLYTGDEIELPVEFKNRVTQIDNNSILYQRYSAVVSTKGVQKGVLNIFLPNQWFYIASFFTRYYNELQKYKRISTEIFSAERLKGLKNSSLTATEENALEKRYGVRIKDLIKNFVTDYDWWGGGKTIDRGDFFVSPILCYAKLVNATQSYVADLCAFLAKNEDLVKLLLNSVKQYNNTSSSEFQNRIISNLPLQQIFYGAPGTGKSHTINEITEQQPKENVFRTTFHPDSDYSTFVGCYKPTMTAKPVRNVAGDVVRKDGKEVAEKSITYSFVPQSFTKAYLRAWQTTEPVYLVIEEINRGNCAQIFGDLFQLLDRKCDGFSEYPIKADNDLATYIAENLSASTRTDIPDSVRSGEELSLPANLYIWATMNTSDQSLFPIDSAFKRRWDWKYVPIDTKKERWSINADGASYDWSDFLEKINAKIESATSSEDKMLGFYFCKAENDVITAERFVNKVVFYLWNDVFKDYGFDDAVFNDKNNKKITFRMFYKADGKVDEAIVKEFLDNLGVNIKDNEEIIEIDDIDETNPAVANKNHLKNITFADGTVFSTNDMGPFDAYIEAIKKIGVDKVYSIADKLKYRRLNHPLISKEKYPEIENSTSYSYMQLGEYYFVKGSKTYTLVRMLEDIKNLLSIDMTINC